MTSPLDELLQAIEPDVLKDAEGSTPAEIGQFERAIGVDVPADYARFLLRFGRSTGAIDLQRGFVFSLDVVLPLLEGAMTSSSQLFPIAYCASGLPADLLCIGRDGFGVWAAYSDQLQKSPDRFWDRSFLHFICRAIFHGVFVDQSKYVFEVSPRPSARYAMWVQLVDVDKEAASILEAIGFRRFLSADAIPLFVAPGGNFATYYRSPNRRVFFIRLGLQDLLLKELVKAEIARVLKVEVVDKSLE